MPAFCPACSNSLTHALVDPCEVGKPIVLGKGLRFTCPECHAVLGEGFDANEVARNAEEALRTKWRIANGVPPPKGF